MDRRIRRHTLGDVLRRLAQRRESEVEEGHLMIDHVHRLRHGPTFMLMDGT